MLLQSLTIPLDTLWLGTEMKMAKNLHYAVCMGVGTREVWLSGSATDIENAY